MKGCGRQGFGAVFGFYLRFSPSIYPFFSNWTHLSCRGIGTHEKGKARDVVGHSLDTDFGLGASHADCTNVATIHRRFDVTKDMLDAYAHMGALFIGGFLFRRQRFVAIGAFVNVGCAALFLQARFLLVRTVGAVSPGVLAVVAWIKNIVQLLTVVDARVRDVVLANELVLAINIDVVFVAVKGDAVLLCPTSVRVLVRFLFDAPISGSFAFLDLLVVVSPV